ncbi:MAG: lectin-like protein [Myxococcota bacterium]
MRCALIAMLLPGCIEWSSLYGDRCGDAHVDENEECDDGNDSNIDACLSTCRWATCGDGHVRAFVEECDDGNQNNADDCTSSCLSCNAGSENFTFSETGSCFSRFDEPLAWNAAELHCDASSGYLSTYVNSHEATAVEAALLVDFLPPAWIGMRDRNANGTYAWVSAEPLQWAKWGRGEPAGPAGACVVVKRDTENWIWATLACDKPSAYICKKEPFVIRAETRHAYLALYADLTWQEAEVACESRRAHLVTITDAAEQSFVASLAAGDFWIGARDDELDGSFTWSTGEPATYSAFAPGEPDHNGGAQCLIMGIDEGWHDRPCNDANAYVCEVDP